MDTSLATFERNLAWDASFLGLTPRRADRMEPREIWGLVRGDRLRWSRVAELVGWAVWLIVGHMPMSGLKAEHRSFQGFMKAFNPPGFIPPPDRKP